MSTPTRVATWLLGVCSFNQLAARPAHPPKTVLDYFLLLPQQKYFEVDRGERLRWLKDTHSTVDIRNGYLFMKGDGAQREIALCLFERAGGSYLIAVSGNHAGDGLWEPWLDLYVYRSGRFADVKRQLWPVYFPDTAGYELPRYGRTILVKTERGKVLYRCAWTGARFRVQRAGSRK